MVFGADDESGQLIEVGEGAAQELPVDPPQGPRVYVINKTNPRFKARQG
jgi:hypothetical protein